ncbi:MAG: TusE/DsrC/DsvC family sulfur relay protein [Planctomycetota bacterium]|jgi:tRNA 2-thiouridine synthesizing protein E
MSRPAAKTVTFGEDKTYTLDQYGFLDPPDQWDEDFADGMARLQGVYDGLTQEHWDFLFYIRDKFLKEKTLPFLVVACADNNLRLDKLKSLFPTGYFRGACRIAGLSYEFLCEVNIWHTYETAPRLKPEYEINSQGFLADFDRWNERFAAVVSEEWDLPDGLTPKHWEIIRFLRNYYQATGNIPTVYEVCEAHGLDLHGFQDLFPGGYRRGACRIAGLPFFA